MRGKLHYISVDLETEAWVYLFLFYATQTLTRGSLDNPKGLQSEDHS